MVQIKIANWNIEWMNRWFSPDQQSTVQFKTSAEAGFDVQELALRVGKVIEQMEADFITIQEGPSRSSEMSLFVEKCLNDQYEIYGPIGKGQQKLFTLKKKASSIIEKVTLIEEEYGFDFADMFYVDINGDLVLDKYEFTRPPLVLKVETTTNTTFHLISLHTKSKYVHNGERLWKLEREEFIKLALQARRRISAEAMRVREYIDLLFEQNPQAKIVVTGDFNDGPGLDYFEKRYLTHNVAGLIAGSPYEPQKMLRHAFVDTMPKEKNYTAEFFDFIEEKQKQILLDHIFVSPNLFWTGNDITAKGQIEHEIYQSMVKSELEGRAKYPSDHRPQTVILEI
jgi:endonuclease/exonuclease/phosphatase family metal-dependent hydrolase